MTTDLATTDRDVGLDTYSPPQLAARLAEMRAERDQLQAFFKEVMIPGHDYGVIPGTEKPTLLKPGAEKLAEFYGYAPTIKAIDEEADRESGYYRVRVTVALVSKRTGGIVAEGVGEANTMEGRYRTRWLTAAKCRDAGIDTAGLESQDRPSSYGDSSYKVFKVENPDPWGLWNTCLKMAKKRAIVDASLSATRSSGLFTQDMEDLTGWVEGEVISSTRTPTPAANPAQRQRQAPARGRPTRRSVDELDQELNANQAQAKVLTEWWQKTRALKVDRLIVIERSKEAFGREPVDLTDEERAELLIQLS